VLSACEQPTQNSTIVVDELLNDPVMKVPIGRCGPSYVVEEATGMVSVADDTHGRTPPCTAVEVLFYLAFPLVSCYNNLRCCACRLGNGGTI